MLASLLRPAVALLAAGAVSSTILVGCTTDPAEEAAGSSSNSLRPAGCSKTLCDLAKARCDDEKSSSGQCRRCMDDCSSRSYDIAFDCMDICRDTVCEPDTSGYDPCASEVQSCRRSDAERACVDNVPQSSYPSTDTSYKAPWKAPLAPHQGWCSEAQVDTFMTKCSASGCKEIDYNCESCIVRSHEKWVEYGPFVDSMPNVGGCVATLTGDSSADGCGAKIFAEDACMLSACFTGDETCRDLAVKSLCKAQHDKAAECRAQLSRDPALAVCAIDDRSPAALRALVTYFCGGKR